MPGLVENLWHMKVLFIEKGKGAQIKKRYNIRNETKPCDKMKWLIPCQLTTRNSSADFLGQSRVSGAKYN